MANEFSVVPLGGLDVGARLENVLEGARSRKRSMDWQKKAPEVIKSGNPDAIADLMLEFPEMQQQVASAAGYKRQQSIQDMVDAAAGILSGTADPAQILGQHIQKAQSAGEDVSRTMTTLGKTLENPEHSKQWAEKILALYSPDQYQAYKKATTPAGVELTASQKDYMLAKSEGFDGSFIDFKNAVSGNFGMMDQLKVMQLQMNIADIQSRLQEKQEKKESLKEIENRRNRSLVGQIDSVVGEIDKGLAQVKLNPRATTGITGAIISNIPGSPAYNLRKRIETIKGNIGFDKLQQMREMSPTGGALGQVAVQELNALQNIISALDPNMGDDELIAGFEKVKTHYNNWRKTLTGQLPSDGEDRPRTVNGSPGVSEVETGEDVFPKPLTTEQQAVKPISEMTDEELMNMAFGR